MATLSLLAHLPTIRIAEERLPLAGGTLWQMPFDQYNQVSLGAFSDHRQAYEETQPVFFYVSLETDLDIFRPGPGPNAAAEMKFPTALADELALKTGFGFFTWFHRTVVDPAWAGLVLAAPVAAPPTPRSSVTFAVPEDGHFEVHDQQFALARAQGDADQEYLFLPETAGSSLPAEVIERADALAHRMDELTADPDLLAGLRGLLDTTSPVLAPAEILTLAVVALEALLLPELRTGLGETFARRAANLLGADHSHREELFTGARRLYDARSASVHGGADHASQEQQAAVRDAFASQLLAGTIQAMLGTVKPGTTAADLRPALDRDSAPVQRPAVVLPVLDPPGRRPAERLWRGHYSVIAVASSGMGESMTGQEGQLISWAPLVGLEGTGNYPLGRDPAAILMTATPVELERMEERDIARDFIRGQVMENDSVALLGLFTESPEVPQPGSDQKFELLARHRNLAVIALRMAGFRTFVDPELLGDYVYWGNLRYRRPTVLRQTVLMRLGGEANQRQRLGPDDADRVRALWDMLVAYDSGARHPEVDHMLALYRRGAEPVFLPAATRASLQFAALEAALGRFRRREDPVKLEHLVRVVVPERDAEWFSARGRSFRDAVAHGRWRTEDDTNESLQQLSNVVGGVVREFLTTWTADHQYAKRRPGKVFIDEVTSRLTRAGTSTKQ
jgi:hypothetical protein